MSFLTTLKQTRSGRIFITLFKIILCVIVGVFIFWQYLIWPNYWDDKTIEDADLLLVVTEPVDDAVNAATYISIQNNLTEAERAILATSPDYREGEFYFGSDIVSGTKLQQFINESRPLVEQFVKASAMPVYQCPLSYGQYTAATELCDLSTLSQLSRLVAFHAHYNMSIGNSARASSFTAAVLSYGKLVVEQEIPSAHIEYLTGMGFYGRALSVIEMYPEVQKNLQPKLRSYLVSDTSNGRAIQAEYAMLKDSILLAFVGQTDAEKKVMTDGTYYMRRNETVNNLAEVMRATVSDVVTPCNLALDAPLKSTVLIEKYQNTVSLIGMMQPNFVGRVMLQTTLADLTGTRSTRCGINARIEALSSN